ncbi:transporter substrate-binding domain-containing protein [bacterium]|nr:transporter substrate-binding domain-containing protein [candidate division CSSED10-310 bacterium]
MLFKHKKISILLIVLFIPILLFPQDGKVLSKILKNGELRVGTSGSQPPFTMKSKDGKLMGYDIELAKMLADVMQVKLKLVEKTFVELLPALEKGEIDLILSGMTITAERNIKASFVGPYLISGKALLAKSKRIEALDEMDELNRPIISVATVKGSTSNQFLHELAPEVKLVLTKEYESGVKLVLDNKVDAMLADFPICVLSLLRYPDSGLAILDDLFTIEPIGITLPPNAFQLHNLIENYLSALQIGGILENLEKKWFQDGSWLIRLP